MASVGVFISPLCKHTITDDRFNEAGIAVCGCGYLFEKQTVLDYQAAEAEAMAANKKYRLAVETLERIRTLIVAQSVNNSKRVNRSQAAASSKSAVSAAPVASAPAPAKPAAPSKPARPARAPLSPRTLLFIVGGSLVLLAFSVFFATTWKDIPPIGQAAVVLFVVALAGFGAVKARDRIRNLANFLSTLSSALLMLGLYAAGLLGMLPKESIDVTQSLYLPVSFVAVGALSQLVGRRFQISGWLSMGPIGVALGAGLASMGYFATQLTGSASAEFGWVLLSLSVGGVLTAVSGRYSKLAIPEFKKPTQEQKFLIEDITGEVRRDRIVVRLAYLATLAQMTLTLVFGLLEAIRLDSVDSWALLALGVFWIAAAIGIERIGGGFTESGTVSPKVVKGAWILGFSSLGLAATGLATRFELVNAPNFNSLFIAIVAAAVLAFSVEFVAELKKYQNARLGATAGAWVTWSSWALLTDGFSLSNDRQIQVFAVLLLLIGATWFGIRAVNKNAGLQIQSVLPAVAAGVIWMANSHASLEAYENVAAALALNLYLASMIIASTALAHAALEQRMNRQPSALTTNVLALGSVGVVLGSLPRAAELWQIGGAEFNMLDLWPLLTLTLLVAVMALASQRNDWIATHPSLRMLTSIQGVTLMAGSFLQVSLAAAISYQKNLGTTLVLVSIANLAIAFVYGIWAKSRGFLYGSLAIATVLAVSFDALLMRDLHYLGWQQLWPSALLIILLSIAVQWGLNGAAKKDTDVPLGGFTAALALVLFGHVVLAFRAFAVYIPQSQFNAWLNTLTLLAIAAVGLLASHTKLTAKLKGLEPLAERIGSLSLVASPIVALLASSATDQVYRLAVVAIVATGIAVFKARSTGSHNWSLGAFALGGVSIWFYGIAIITALIPTGLDLAGTINIAGYVSLGALFVWNASYRKLTHDLIKPVEGWQVPIFEIVATTIALSWVTGYNEMTYLAMTGNLDWPETAVLVGPVSPEVPNVITMLVLVALVIWARIRSGLKSGAFSPTLRNGALIVFLFGVASIFTSHIWASTSVLVITAVALVGFAVAMFIDGYFSHERNLIIGGFASAVLGGWSMASYLMLEQHWQLAQLFNFAAIASFVVATWLLRRNPAGFNLNSWSMVLPVVSATSILIGLSMRGAVPTPTQPVLWDLEWMIGLALAVAYLFISRTKWLDSLRRAQDSALLSAALSWLLSVQFVAADPSPGAIEQHWTAIVFYGVSLIALLVFATRNASKYALYAGAPIALMFGLALRQLLRADFGIDAQGPEIIALGVFVYSAVASRIYVTKVDNPASTLFSWGVPAGVALLPSAAYLAVYSGTALSQQTSIEIWRLILVAVVSLVTLVVAMRVGNLGLTAAATTTMLLALVPALYNRIDDIFVSVSVRGEMKALLVAVTIYVLLYLLRRTRKLELPSLVAWGIPTVIALGATLLDALAALSKTTLDTEDWIRFGVLIAAGTVFLVLGAIRKIGGFFYPGLVAILAAAIPYAFKPGGFGLWAVLLSLAALIVWVAVRLDRFTGWLKQLK